MSRILVIEDDDSLRRGIAMMLGTRGHQAVEAADAQVGLAQTRAQPPDLMIVDVQTPAGGAPMVIQTIDAQPSLAKIPIIFISGMPEKALAQWFPATPTRQVHSKPLDWDRLWTQIEQLLSASKS
ncbi:MAG: response regulator [Elusimicrobia bacterium]|nr:response regulator [Elusimicrobiota bacterium]